VLDNPEASIVITEFGDFGCHGCQAWHEAGIRDNILRFYGDDVAFVWRDFPVITSRSPKAAQAGQCAHDQGQFWAYHDHVYEHGQRLSETSLKAYASDIGLDMATFSQCLDSNKYQRIAEKGTEDARQLRLRGTPSFLINGQALAGPPPFRYLADLIDQELARLQDD
jgi:protein-disulfide isomerase